MLSGHAPAFQTEAADIDPNSRNLTESYAMAAPNFLILMVDQLNGTLFPDGPADWLHAPNLKALAARSTRFSSCYTASALCAPDGQALCQASCHL